MVKYKEINMINVLMCFCVVIIHLTSTPVSLLEHNSLWYFVMFIINKFLTFAVPVFIFLSGFKLYNKYKDSKISLKEFYLGRFRKIVIPYLVAFSIYFIFYYYWNLVKWKEFFPSLLSGTLVAHFYYIIIAIQFYLLFPLLHKLFNKSDKLLLIISFICTIVLNQFIFFNYSDRFFGTYIFYFILGMLIAKHYSQKEIKPFWVFLIIYFFIALIHIYLCYKMSLDIIWYKYCGIGQVLYTSLACIVIYNLCLKSRNEHVEKLVNIINPHTFYIFLYHIIIINILQFVIYPRFNLSIKYQFIISFIVVYSVIFVYCWIRNLFLKKR